MSEIADPQDDEVGQGKQDDQLQGEVADYPDRALLQEDETPEERRVNLIVGGIAAGSMAAVDSVHSLVEGDESEEMLQLMYNTMSHVYELLRGAGVQKRYVGQDGIKEWDTYAEAKAVSSEIFMPSEVFRVADEVTISTELLAVVCVTLKKVNSSYDEEAVGLKGDLMEMVLEVLDRSIDKKVKAYESRTVVPLNLNEEVTFLQYLRAFLPVDDIDAVIGKALGTLHYQQKEDAVKEDCSREGFGEYLGHLAKRGKYQKLLDFRAEHPTSRIYGNDGQFIIDARIKKACFVDFDENGLPFSNDVTPQYLWADFQEYRRRFFEASNVPAKLEVMRRASVAELLRKLVNKDLDYGESHEAGSTEVGLYSEELDERYIRIITRGLDSAFERTKEPLPVLFRPLEDMLKEQMDQYELVLNEKYGKRFTLLEPRIKTPESTMLKMLKEGKTTVASITDLIGFTVLTDTEDEAEQVYAEIKASMSPEDIKEALTWEKQPSRGYKSMDITGVPEGFQTRIQVQCRTKGLDEKNSGQLSNHEAYKVFSGRELLGKIEENPGKYLDQLYQIVHNLRCAYGMLQQEPVRGAEVVLDHYGSNFQGPMSIVRTGKLY